MKNCIKFIFIAASLSNLLLALGCKEEDPISALAFVIAGRYQYSGYDIDSTLFAYGVIDLALTDSIITGTRNIQAVDTINSQTGETGVGSISGTMYSDSSFIIFLTSTRLPLILIQGKFSTGLITGPRILDTGARPRPLPNGYYTLQKK